MKSAYTEKHIDTQNTNLPEIYTYRNIYISELTPAGSGVLDFLFLSLVAYYILYILIIMICLSFLENASRPA